MPILDLSKAEYSFSVNGKKFAILSLTFEFIQNAPPQITCRAVPSIFPKNEVINTSNANLFWAYLSEASACSGKPCVSLSISSLGEDVNMKFNAKDWVLVDVGLAASASAESPAAIEFSIQHPIVQLSKYPATAGPVKNAPDVDEITGSSYLEIVKSALKVYADNVSDSAKQQPTFELFKEGISRLDEFITCEGCDISSFTKLFPWVTDSKQLICGFKQYVLSCIEHGSTNSNLFSFVAGSLASELSLGLYYDTSDISSSKMILKPKIPFSKDGVVSIDTGRVTGMQSSTGDWLAPSGLFMSTSQLRIPEFNAPEDDGQSMQEPIFVSVAVKDGGTQTVPVGLPGWVNAMLGYVYSYIFNAPDELAVANDTLDFSNEEHVKSIRKILTQYFLDMYLQSKNIVVNHLFSINADSGGNLLLPGCTCKLSDPKGKAGLLFLITRVQHNFSLIDNQATTMVSGNYVRGSGFSVEVLGADPEKLISDGFSESKNYIWG